MKYSVCLFFIGFFTTCFEVAWAEYDIPLEMKMDQDLYAVVTIPDHSPENAAHSIKNESSIMEKGTLSVFRVNRIRENLLDGEMDAGTKCLQSFPVTRINAIENSPDNRVLMINGIFRKYLINKNKVLFINHQEPSKHHSISFDKPITSKYIYKDDKLFVGVIPKSDKSILGEMTLINLDDFSTLPASLEDWTGVISDEPLRVENGLLYFNRTGLTSIKFPETPPLSLLGKAQFMTMLWQDADRIVLRRDKPIEDDVISHLLIYSKSDKTWKMVDIHGGYTSGTMVGPWYIARISWGYPEAERFGPFVSNELTFYNCITGDKKKGWNNSEHYLYLEPDFWLMLQKGKLMWETHKKEYDKVKVSSHVEVYTNIWNDDRQQYIRAVFFGPLIHGKATPLPPVKQKTEDKVSAGHVSQI